MPTKTSSPAKSPANAKKATKTETDPSGAKLARAIAETVKERLQSEFAYFMKSSNLEEQRTLSDILTEFTQRGSGARPRSVGEYEHCLLSAIQRLIDGSACVVVPDDDMVVPVEDFIASLQAKRWKAEPWKMRPEPAEVLRRHEKSFRFEIELFAGNAGLPSLAFMHDLLARWQELSNDPEGKDIPNVLAAATEIELAKLRTDEAADEALKATRAV